MNRIFLRKNLRCRRFWIFCFILSIFGGLVSCTDSNQEMVRWMVATDKVRVLATTAMISDLVCQVGGDYVDCITLIKGDLDPHSYQPVKGDDEKFIMADLIFYNGLGLEHGPSWQYYLSQEGKSVGLGNEIQRMYPHLIIYDEYGQRDPHIWTDISLWAKGLSFIVDALCDRDPDHAKTYRSNGEKVYQRLVREHKRAFEQMQEIPACCRFLVTSHDAFNYFCRAYLSTEDEREQGCWQKRFAAPEGLAPDSQLSVTDIRKIVDYLQCNSVRVLFVESNLSADSIKKIVSAGREIGLELTIADTPLYGDAMGPPGSEGETYLKMFQHNVQTISRYLMDHDKEFASNRS